MTFRDSPWPDGTPCWVDLMAPDRKQAMDFYGRLFGWDFREGTEEAGFYTLALIDGRPVAGLGETPPDQLGMPAVWTTYLSVSDVDKVVEAVTEAGGQIMMPPMDVMTEGRMAVAADPTGAVFGLWQPRDYVGVQVVNVPGTFAWAECMTRDFETAKNFYTKVFGYGIDEMSGDGFTYATLTVGGNIVGGLGVLPADVPAEVPAHWAKYFWVRDTDIAVGKITELGGAAVNPPFDSPYGKIAIVADNRGAQFRVIAPNEQSGTPEGWDS
jgi:predicted enzyme related to lactoylglutathione lyase